MAHIHIAPSPVARHDAVGYTPMTDNPTPTLLIDDEGSSPSPTSTPNLMMAGQGVVPQPSSHSALLPAEDEAGAATTGTTTVVGKATAMARDSNSRHPHLTPTSSTNAFESPMVGHQNGRDSVDTTPTKSSHSSAVKQQLWHPPTPATHANAPQHPAAAGIIFASSAPAAPTSAAPLALPPLAPQTPPRTAHPTYGSSVVPPCIFANSPDLPRSTNPTHREIARALSSTSLCTEHSEGGGSFAGNGSFGRRLQQQPLVQQSRRTPRTQQREPVGPNGRFAGLSNSLPGTPQRGMRFVTVTDTTGSTRRFLLSPSQLDALGDDRSANPTPMTAPSPPATSAYQRLSAAQQQQSRQRTGAGMVAHTNTAGSRSIPPTPPPPYLTSGQGVALGSSMGTTDSGSSFAPNNSGSFNRNGGTTNTNGTNPMNSPLDPLDSTTKAVTNDSLGAISYSGLFYRDWHYPFAKNDEQRHTHGGSNNGGVVGSAPTARRRLPERPPDVPFPRIRRSNTTTARLAMSSSSSSGNSSLSASLSDDHRTYSPLQAIFSYSHTDIALNARKSLVSTAFLLVFVLVVVVCFLPKRFAIPPHMLQEGGAAHIHGHEQHASTASSSSSSPHLNTQHTPRTTRTAPNVTHRVDVLSDEERRGLLRWTAAQQGVWRTRREVDEAYARAVGDATEGEAAVAAALQCTARLWTIPKRPSVPAHRPVYEIPHQQPTLARPITLATKNEGGDDGSDVESHDTAATKTCKPTAITNSDKVRLCSIAEATRGITRALPVFGNDSAVCQPPTRVDEAYHYYRTGGPEGYKERYERLADRGRSFRRVFALAGSEVVAGGSDGNATHLPLADAISHLAQNPQMVAMAAEVCGHDGGRPMARFHTATVDILLPGQLLPTSLRPATFVFESKPSSSSPSSSHPSSPHQPPRLPQWLRTAMTFSGLFDDYQRREADVTAFYHDWLIKSEFRAGMLRYWSDAAVPQGIDVPPLSRSAVAMDASVTAHSGSTPYLPPTAPRALPRLPEGADVTLAYNADARVWRLHVNGEIVGMYRDNDLRLSVTFTASCGGEDAEGGARQRKGLGSVVEIVETFRADLRRREVPGADGFMTTAEFATVLAQTYVRYPLPAIADVPYNYCWWLGGADWASTALRGLLCS